MLRLGNRHPIAGNNHDAFGVGQHSSDLVGLHSDDLTLLRRIARTAAAAGRRSKAAGDHRDKASIHRATHDVRQDRAATSDQCSGDDQQIIAQHEARG